MRRGLGSGGLRNGLMLFASQKNNDRHWFFVADSCSIASVPLFKNVSCAKIRFNLPRLSSKGTISSAIIMVQFISGDKLLCCSLRAE